jgi:hypothetical protein
LPRHPFATKSAEPPAPRDKPLPAAAQQTDSSAWDADKAELVPHERPPVRSTDNRLFAAPHAGHRVSEFILNAFFALPQNSTARRVGPIRTATKLAAAFSAASVSLLRDCCATDLLP